jgi:hypothetical protein
MLYPAELRALKGFTSILMIHCTWVHSDIRGSIPRRSPALVADFSLRDRMVGGLPRKALAEGVLCVRAIGFR